MDTVQITGPPAHRVVASGSNVLFSVTATGGGLRYLWFRNGGTFLADTATGAYTVTNAQASDAGAYTAIVSNLAGVATSPPATLQVEYRPVLDPPGLKTVDELSVLTFDVTADADIPTDGLVFTLDGTPPAGATISSAGRFHWLPSERQGPGDYTFTVRATDQGVLRLVGTTSFSVQVNEVNTPPWFVDTRMKYAQVGRLLSFPTAADRDLPSNHVAVTLAPDAPAGAMIDPANGEFSWTPTDAQASGDYAVETRATDNGTPPLAARFVYAIRVAPANEILLVVNVTWVAGHVRLHWVSTPGKTYQVETAETAGRGGWMAAGPPLVASGAATSVEFPAAASMFLRVVQLD